MIIIDDDSALDGPDQPMIGDLRAGQLFELADGIYMALDTDRYGGRWPTTLAMETWPDLRACVSLTGSLAGLPPRQEVDRLVVLRGSLAPEVAP